MDSYDAGVIAASKAIEQIKCKNCDFVFMFGTAGHDHNELIKGAQSILGNIPLTGCSADGIITDRGPNEELFGVGLMVFKSDKIKFFNAVSHNLKEDSLKAGEEIGTQLSNNPLDNAKSLFIFPDGLSVNTKALFNGIQKNLNVSIPYVGGLSADNMKMKPELIWQYHNDKAYQNSVACALLTGKINIEIGVSHGCNPIGIVRTITKSIANRIYEIDGRPAFETLKEFSDDDTITEMTPELVVHLCYGEVLPSELCSEYDKYIIRTPLTHNIKDGSITIPTELSTGTKVIIMRRDPETIINNTIKLTKKIKKSLKSNPKTILQFNCAGRGKILYGRDSYKEFEASYQEFRNVPWLGFYGFGEIAPIKNNNYFHNYTTVLLILY